jgi:hypothetical protein
MACYSRSIAQVPRRSDTNPQRFGDLQVSHALFTQLPHFGAQEGLLRDFRTENALVSYTMTSWADDLKRFANIIEPKPLKETLV